MNSWSLESVKAGDVLLISSHFKTDDKLATVDRVTKTQVVIGNSRYRISDGRAVGYGSEWNIPRAMIPTKEQVAAVEFSASKNRLIKISQSKDITPKQVHDMLMAFDQAKEKAE